MIIHIDQTSPLPPYEQIRGQLATMAATGVLPAGARLPTIRQLARDLGLANGTVSRAYRELERAGVVATHGRHGTVITGDVPARPDPDRQRELKGAAATYAVQAHQLGATADEALEHVAEALGALATSN